MSLSHLPDFLQPWELTDAGNGKAFVLDHRSQVMFFVSREAAEEIMQTRREFLDAIIVDYDASVHNLRPKNSI
jgi:hypothetical protein